MAKNPNDLSGFEDTGGLFSSLFAEEDEFGRRRTLWRVGCWAAVSISALVIAVIANQSNLGWRREQAMTADLVQQTNRFLAVARESQKETRRLAAAVETLNSDRDRLYTRVTVLEQGVESATGTIARPSAAPASVQSDLPAAQPSAPSVAAVSAKPAVQAERIAGAASAEVAAVVKELPVKPSTAPATPLVEAKSMMAPPDPAAGKLVEPSQPAAAIAVVPAVVAATLPGESAALDAAETDLPRIQRSEFGVDLGGANSIAGLRSLWRGLQKSKSNLLLATLQPIIVIREGSGRSLQLRLVAGPLRDAAAAAKLCAVLSETDRDCETAVYDGQRLTFKSDETPAEPKPASPPTTGKRSATQKRAAGDEPAKRATTASNWSIFGRKN